MIQNVTKDDGAVSPVIGVILLVAVTVALVALATVIVFDIGSDVSDTADATVQLEQNGDSIDATVIRNENVAGFTVSDSDDSADALDDASLSPEVGSSISMDFSANPDTDRTVTVVAELESGETEVLTSTDYQG